jgi:hypothetical protein
MGRSVGSALLLSASIVIGCAEQPTALEGSPSLGQDGSGGGGITPMCQLGCTDPDPYPSYPGYYLGSGVTPTLCVHGDYNDQDEDGFGDYCETWIGTSFAPELYTWSSDYVDREPRWALTPLTASGTHVRVAYLFSYYRDEGPVGWCPFGGELCQGHNGDSEMIVVDIRYVATKKHWIVDTATFMHHANFSYIKRGLGETYPQTVWHWNPQIYNFEASQWVATYPHKAGGYLRVFVAQGKHASYFHPEQCNTNGLGTDVCDDLNTLTRLETTGINNLGSRDNPFIDCVSAQNPSHPYYGSPREECYWNFDEEAEEEFRGWFPLSAGGGGSTLYAIKLCTWGFGQIPGYECPAIGYRP